MKWYLAIPVLFLATNLYAAPAPKSESEAQPTLNQTENQASDATKVETNVENKVEAENQAEITDTDPEIEPVETLGGTGLKNRKLSEVFEKFVPSESISADNAVPFPVDI
tara:strand:- start:15565 stop:15894 length:330 start_codon:yes stop_codon:yes gene_type:complete